MYRYKVKFLEEETGKEEVENGICAAKCYKDAASAIVDFFGEEYITDMRLYAIEDILCDKEITDVLKD